MSTTGTRPVEAIVEVTERGPDCPVWCREHTYDTIDGSFIGHSAPVDPGTDREGIYLDLILEAEPSSVAPDGPYIHLETIDACLSVTQATSLASALLRACTTLDPAALDA